jgi:hypothetical protein
MFAFRDSSVQAHGFSWLLFVTFRNLRSDFHTGGKECFADSSLFRSGYWKESSPLNQSSDSLILLRTLHPILVNAYLFYDEFLGNNFHLHLFDHRYYRFLTFKCICCIVTLVDHLGLLSYSFEFLSLVIGGLVFKGQIPMLECFASIFFDFFEVFPEFFIASIYFFFLYSIFKFH